MRCRPAPTAAAGAKRRCRTWSAAPAIAAAARPATTAPPSSSGATVAAHTAARSAAVVWLRHAACAPAPVSVDGRAEHAAHLQAVAAAPEPHRRRPELAFAEDRGPAPAADPLVCGLCRGRCCNAGRATQGFIDAELLERHAAEHGGTHDAAAAYLARVPPEHVAGSCLYHGAQGCVLPRTMRAPVCNGFARPPLEQARALDAAGAAMVLAAYDGAVLRGAAFVAGGLREAEALRRADS